MKVLYISDSLGTPIHPRGIFNYSVALVEILRSLGAEVDLIVEHARNYGLDKDLDQIDFNSLPTRISMRLAEIGRYYDARKYSAASIIGGSRRLRKAPSLFFNTVRSLIALALGLKKRRQIYVPNNPDSIDFMPEPGAHLSIFSGFVWKDMFYSSSVMRAMYRLAPEKIDASGYDLAIVDTPHFVNVSGIDPGRMIAVVHDLIPLRDPTMGTDLRYLFVQKLRASMDLRSNVVFVSEYTKSSFHQAFPDDRLRRETVLYPALRQSLVKSAENAMDLGETYRPESDDYEDDESLDGTERSVLVDLAKPPKPKLSRRKSRSVWDPRLPYFATVISDEPRKNIPVIVKAFRLLKGKANVVIIGQASKDRYLTGDDGRLGHIHFAGYVADADKSAILHGAAGLIFPSFAEGFGIPLVEGAIFGVPVLCSDIDVFREVAGENAVYFDPYNAATLAEAVKATLAAPEELRATAAALREQVLLRFSQKAMGDRLAALLGAIGLTVAGEVGGSAL